MLILRWVPFLRIARLTHNIRHPVSERYGDSSTIGMLGSAYRQRRAEQFQPIGAVNGRVIGWQCQRVIRDRTR